MSDSIWNAKIPGTKVQFENKDGEFVCGVVEAFEPAKSAKDYDYCVIKTGDNVLVKVRRWDLYPVDSELERKFRPVDSELERKFRVAMKEANQLIFEQINVARDAILKAQEISEKYGVPFRSSVSPLGQTFCPTSLHEKFSEVDRAFVMEVTETNFNYDGWQHSSICY